MAPIELPHIRLPDAIAAGRNPALLGESLRSLHIIEVEQSGPATGTIVWECLAWDHLIQDYDPDEANYWDVVLDLPRTHPVKMQAADNAYSLYEMADDELTPENILKTFREIETRMVLLPEGGPRPTLIEWDTDVPDWPTLRANAARSKSAADSAVMSRCGVASIS